MNTQIFNNNQQECCSEINNQTNIRIYNRNIQVKCYNLI